MITKQQIDKKKEELRILEDKFKSQENLDYQIIIYKNKEFSYKLERKDPQILYNDIYNLLTEKLGILSQKEKAEKKIIFYELEKKIKESRQDWAAIRRKNIKDTMYEKYVLDMKEQYSLSTPQCKFLLSAIVICIMFKTILSKDVIYNGTKIERIDGINFKQGEIILERPLCGKHFDDANLALYYTQEKITKRMADNWEKYISCLGKGSKSLISNNFVSHTENAFSEGI